MKVNKSIWKFIDDTFSHEDVVVLQGGKRAGKTFTILQYIHVNSLMRVCKTIIVTDTYARLRDSIISDFRMISSETPNMLRIIESGTPRLVYNNGSEISFCCADKDTRGFTSDKDYIFFNECIMYEENVVRDVLKAGGNNCKVFFDYNPFTRFYVNEKYETETNKLVVNYKNNPFCPKFAKEQLDNQSEIGKLAKSGTIERYLYEVECLGANAELSGLCFPNVDSCTDAEYDDCKVPEVLSSDWGQVLSSADPDVVCGFKFDGNKILCREYYYRNDGTDADIADVLKDIPFEKQWFVYETATAGEARIRNIYNLSGLRFRFVPCSKGVGSIMIGIRNLQEYEIKITESSKNFHNEQKNYKYITKNDIMMPSDKYNHAFDCLRYAFDFWCNNKTKVK